MSQTTSPVGLKPGANLKIKTDALSFLTTCRVFGEEARPWEKTRGKDFCHKILACGVYLPGSSKSSPFV